VDTSHPTLFDHPLDHVPGMLSIEAVRQAVQSEAPRALLTGVDVTFARYIEFDAPCWIDMYPVARQEVGAPHERVRVDAVQNGLTAFSATAFFVDPASL
jgi:2-oxo-3-(phosphooxy)propyl 3-oxoalkanoate synthase